MKKSLFIFISFVLVLGIVLSGCSSKKEETATSTMTPEATAVATPVATIDTKALEEEEAKKKQALADEKKNEKFTIRLGAWFVDERPHMVVFKQAIEKKFKELYPNATIQWDVILGEPYFAKLQAQVASNTAPDVFFMDPGLIKKYAEANYLADVTDQPYVATLNDGVKAVATWNGKIYGTATSLGSSGIWYNKKMFADLGLKVPKTWSEFLDIGDKLNAAKITPMVLGFKDAWTIGLLIDNMVQSIGYSDNANFGQDLFDGKIKINGPEIQSILLKLEDLTARKFFNKTALSIDWPQSSQVFTQGKAAMIAQGGWMPGSAMENFTKDGTTPFDVGYFQVPTDNGNPVMSVDVSTGLVVNAKSKYMEQSNALVSLILSPEILAPVAVGDGTIPAIKGVQVDYPLVGMKEMLGALNENKVAINFQKYLGNNVVDVLRQATSKIVSGEKFNPKDLEEGQKALDKQRSDGTLVQP
ncbi:extracellular solute-binding protein [Paenibacillus psychroresistens]|nr:extracellular solute-binding protein [Paenibacillus psychroresistens]